MRVFCFSIISPVFGFCQLGGIKSTMAAVFGRLDPRKASLTPPIASPAMQTQPKGLRVKAMPIFDNLWKLRGGKPNVTRSANCFFLDLLCQKELSIRKWGEDCIWTRFNKKRRKMDLVRQARFFDAPPQSTLSPLAKELT